MNKRSAHSGWIGLGHERSDAGSGADSPMSNITVTDYAVIRNVMAAFSPAPKIEPNDHVPPDSVFTPYSHRAVLDPGRQLVVGNRGMGKSLWTHALTNPEVRNRVASVYGQPSLNKTDVVIGFNGADKLSAVAPTRNAIERALSAGYNEDEIWCSVIFRAICSANGKLEEQDIEFTLKKLKASPILWENELSAVDDKFASQGKTVLILFDALDRLADDWQSIRQLTTGLMKRALGLRSFHSFRAKIFIRPDQYSDQRLFEFSDGSKLKNSHVDLSWQPHELFGLLLFEICRDAKAKTTLQSLANKIGASAALKFSEQRNRPAFEEQNALINSIAGTYMGSDKRRGRVYTWVPLHLSDAKETCSPRTFLTAWQKAAGHEPAPKDRAVDHLGLIEGVRRASSVRLEELREDYRWIDDALEALKGQFVPIERENLLDVWKNSQIVQKILKEAKKGRWLAPVELDARAGPAALLEAMKSIAVMEERANGKINVPDIFRVEAGIKRKGGVAVPRRN